MQLAINICIRKIWDQHGQSGIACLAALALVPGTAGTRDRPRILPMRRQLRVREKQRIRTQGNKNQLKAK